MPLALLVCVALARAVAAANTRLLTSRKGRDLAVLSGLVIAIGIQFVNFGAQRLGDAGGLSALDPVADVVRWLPPACRDRRGRLGGRGRVRRAPRPNSCSPLGALGLLLYAWQRSLVKLMTTPDGSTLAASDASRKESSGKGLAALLPEGRTGTVMLRTLRYAWRDPKTKAAWITSLAIGLIVPVFNALQGAGTVYFACFATGMLGMQMYNQFGQDTSAFWMVLLTISSTRDAYLELRARALALLLVTLPYTLLVTGVTAGHARRLAEAARGHGARARAARRDAGDGLGGVGDAGVLDPAGQPQERGAGAGRHRVPVDPRRDGGGRAAVRAGDRAGDLAARVRNPRAALWLLLPLGAVYGALIGWAGLKVAAPRAAARLPEILTAVSTG